MNSVHSNLISSIKFIFLKFKQNKGRKRSAERSGEDEETLPTQPKRCSLAEANPVSPNSMEAEQSSRSLVGSVSDVAVTYYYLEFSKAVMLICGKQHPNG